MTGRDDDKWIEWARAERERYRRYLALAKAGKFRTSEVDDSGQWKDSTADYIRHLTAAIASLDQVIGAA